jgi:hypothetical protein
MGGAQKALAKMPPATTPVRILPAVAHSLSPARAGVKVAPATATAAISEIVVFMDCCG